LVLVFLPFSHLLLFLFPEEKERKKKKVKCFELSVIDITYKKNKRKIL